MSTASLLSRLERVRAVGPGRWVASCPAHPDRTPSLSVRELDDGRVLVHDFGGCSVEAIVRAVGLGLEALFPPRPIEHAKRQRRPFDAADVLAAVAGEIRIVAVAACNLRQGATLSDDDHDRLLVAAERVEEARGLTGG